jgi:hypothetical protein
MHTDGANFIKSDERVSPMSTDGAHFIENVRG